MTDKYGRCFSRSGWWQTLCGLDAANQGFGWSDNVKEVECSDCLSLIEEGEHRRWKRRHILMNMRRYKRYEKKGDTVTVAKLIDLNVMNELYRITNYALKAKSDDVKLRLIGTAEEELQIVLEESDKYIAEKFGAEWKDKVVVLATVMSGASLNYLNDQLEDVSGTLESMNEKQNDAFYASMKVTSQLSFVVGFMMALKASGTWEKFKAEIDGGSGDKEEDQ